MSDRDERLANQLEVVLSDYFDDPDVGARHAARSCVEEIRLAGWVPALSGVVPAEDEPEGSR